MKALHDESARQHMSKIDLKSLEALATAALVAGNTSEANARIVAAALVAADADGLDSHGVSRVPFYADQAASGKVDGHGVPRLEQLAASAVRVDAVDGFAYPAIQMGLERTVELSRNTGIAVLSVANSHHCGAFGHHVEGPAEHGLMALGFSNTPAGIAPWGGTRGSFGTNPIGFACPREAKPPLVVDLSLSTVARGKVMLAQKRGESIPDNWALDAEGHATTDPRAALAGTMLPIGGAKGSALAMMVELLTAALAGANFAFEASSFFTAAGPPPRIAQTFIVLNPAILGAPTFFDRVEALIAQVSSQPGTRLPGDRRYSNRAASQAHGVEISEDLLTELRQRAGA
jgi:(2R)-3-sulfolactate dehydrogenase (NADP+)